MIIIIYIEMWVFRGHDTFCCGITLAIHIARKAAT